MLCLALKSTRSDGWPTTTVPQGVGNYGTAQVSSPTPGTWTAYIWSRDSADGGTTGPVLFGASVARYQRFGLLSSNHLRIPAGSTRSVKFFTLTSFTPGDESGSIVATPAGQPTALTIPVTLRVLGVGERSFLRACSPAATAVR